MFEQRLMSAYRENVAREREEKLLEEIEEEKRQREEREAKRKNDKLKKKERKRLQKLAQEEERLRKQQELERQQAELKEKQRLKGEETRRKKQEQKMKKEAERKRLEEERRLKIEAERKKELQKKEQEEKERKEREARLLKEKEEQERKAKEEMEAKRKAEEERIAKEQKEKEERLEKESAERERKEAAEQAERERKEREAREQEARAAKIKLEHQKSLLETLRAGPQTLEKSSSSPNISSSQPVDNTLYQQPNTRYGPLSLANNNQATAPFGIRNASPSTLPHQSYPTQQQFVTQAPASESYLSSIGMPIYNQKDPVQPSPTGYLSNSPWLGNSFSQPVSQTFSAYKPISPTISSTPMMQSSTISSLVNAPESNPTNRASPSASSTISTPILDTNMPLNSHGRMSFGESNGQPSLTSRSSFSSSDSLFNREKIIGAANNNSNATSAISESPLIRSYMGSAQPRGQNSLYTPTSSIFPQQSGIKDGSSDSLWSNGNISTNGGQDFHSPGTTTSRRGSMWSITGNTSGSLWGMGPNNASLVDSSTGSLLDKKTESHMSSNLIISAALSTFDEISSAAIDGKTNIQLLYMKTVPKLAGPRIHLSEFAEACEKPDQNGVYHFKMIRDSAGHITHVVRVTDPSHYSRDAATGSNIIGAFGISGVNHVDGMMNSSPSLPSYGMPQNSLNSHSLPEYMGNVNPNAAFTGLKHTGNNMVNFNSSAGMVTSTPELPQSATSSSSFFQSASTNSSTDNQMPFGLTQGMPYPSNPPISGRNDIPNDSSHLNHSANTNRSGNMYPIGNLTSNRY